MFLTDILQQKLLEEQDSLLQRLPYQRGGDGRKRNGFKPLRIKSLFNTMILKRLALARKDAFIPNCSTFSDIWESAESSLLAISPA